MDEDEIKEVDYICLCEPICPLDCDPKRRHRDGLFEEDYDGGDARHKMVMGGRDEEGDALLGQFAGMMGIGGDLDRLEGIGMAGEDFGEGEFEGELEEVECGMASTTSGNILDRIIRDPSRKRAPCLGKYSQHIRCLNLDAEERLNAHQYNASQQPTALEQMTCLRVTSEPNNVKQPAIIGTIGPSCSTPEDILELMKEGMNIARVNMAYADPCDKASAIKNVIEAGNRYSVLRGFNVSIGLIMDLKGPEIRTGKLEPGRSGKGHKSQVKLHEGDYVKITSDKNFENRCSEKVVYIDYPFLVVQVVPGMTMVLSDGAIKLQVALIDEVDIICRVESEGVLGSYQKVQVPMLPLNLPTVSAYDVECCELALQLNVDIIAVSNVRNEETVCHVRRLLEKKQKNNNVLLLAKISNYEGVRNIDRILAVSDGIVIQRRDLALELSLAKVFIAQKEIIGKCNRLGKPVICSTLMLPSMVENSTPARAEISDAGSCIVDGADCVALTNETAAGRHGVTAVQHLQEICREAEAATMQIPYFTNLVDMQVPAIEPKIAIALAAVQVAMKLRASAILAITTSGKTAQLLSWFRPRCFVLAITRVGKVARQLNLWRAVFPLHYTGETLETWFEDCNARFQYGISIGTKVGIINSGDALVLVGGFRKGGGFTNSIRIVYATPKPGEFVDSVRGYYASAGN